MFLNHLLDTEKEAFISLSVHAANSNGVFAEEEKMMLNEYCKEMNLEVWDTVNIMTMDEIIEVFQKSSIHSKKIIMFEILGLVYSDGEYDSDEKNFIKEYARKVGLKDEDVEEQTKLIVKYMDLLKEIVKVIS